MLFQDHTFNRFINQHKVIKFHLEGLPPEAIYKLWKPENLSIHETIAYVCRYQYVFLNRINSICQNLNPQFSRYRPEIDPQMPFMIAKRTGSLINEINRMRSNLLQLLKELPDHYVNRMGTHSLLGRMNLNQWLDFFLLHESIQLFKIFKLSRRFHSEEMMNEHDHKTLSFPGKIEEIA